MNSKKIIAIILSSLLILNTSSPSVAYAVANLEIPSHNIAIPTPPSSPSNSWTIPTPPTMPTQALMPTATPFVNPTPALSVSSTPKQPKPTKSQSVAPTSVPQTNGTSSQANDNTSPSPKSPNETGSGTSTGDQSNGDNLEGNVGIDSGSVAGNANLNNITNNNSSEYGGTSSNNSVVENSGNGSGSNNNGSINSNSDTDINQENDAYIDNGVEVDFVTGENKIHDNLGGSSSIKTGSATSAVNIFNFANTNLTGADISSNEFNIADDQSGDIDLTGSLSGCTIAMCGGTNADINNAKNGSNSTNNGVIQNGNNLFITTDNFAQVDNSINIDVETGSNTIADSVGDSSIETGDANVVANIFNFLNNSFVALTDLVVNTVNILGDYAGNIILPEGSSNSSSGYAVNNSGNGSTSLNNGTINDSTTLDIRQQNNAEINNTIVVDANTGENKLMDNISGDNDTNSVKTGSINATASATTVANQNFTGNDLNIIFLNQAGELKAYYIDQQGELVPISSEVANNDNGTESVNTGTVNNSQTTEIDQTNTAVVNNTININANTGNNKIADNIDGSTSINTGDANIVSSITNFVNNNFAGGRVIFTVVNDLFGKWTGKFVNGKNNTVHENQNVGAPLESSNSLQSSESELVQVTDTTANKDDSFKVAEPLASSSNSHEVKLAQNVDKKTNNNSNENTIPVFALGTNSDDSTGTSSDSGSTTQSVKGKKAATTSNDGPTADLALVKGQFEWPALNPWKVTALVSSFVLLGVFIARKRFIAT